MAIDSKQIMRNILDDIKTFGLRNFDLNWRVGQYADDGGNLKLWKPRKQSYAHPIMIKSGDSINSLTSNITTAQITFKVLTPYIKYHQVGTGRLPARPVLYHDKAMDQEVGDSIKKNMKVWFDQSVPKQNR